MRGRGLIVLLAGLVTIGGVGSVLAGVGGGRDHSSAARSVDARSMSSALIRVEATIAPGSRSVPHAMVLTLGGPVYCGQLRRLARHLQASLVCADYGRNGDTGKGTRSRRQEDWGDPAYLAAAARLPDRLRREGVKISKLLLIGVSYSGFANAELVATHPEMRPSALIVVDSYLDLRARFNALPRHHITRREITQALGGTPASGPTLYASRSPSHHLDGLARAIRDGMRLVVIWSVSPAERREFRGATCSRLANAEWLSQLATKLRRPLTAYVTRMRHAHALWDRGASLAALAGTGRSIKPLIATRIEFRPHTVPPPRSYCPAYPSDARSTTSVR